MSFVKFLPNIPHIRTILFHLIPLYLKTQPVHQSKPVVYTEVRDGSPFTRSRICKHFGQIKSVEMFDYFQLELKHFK